jgi:putative transcriptional regulator
MKPITHHPPVEWLAEYASGTAHESVGLLIATHATLCPQCRVQIAQMEAIGGALMVDAAPAEVGDHVLDALMKRLDEPVPAEPAPRLNPELDYVPMPLRTLVADRPWKRIAPGIEGIELDLKFGPEPVAMVRLRPGTKLREHTHSGLNFFLVLQGGFTDTMQGGKWRRGDVQVADETIVHALSIDPGEPCVTLMLREGPDIQRTLVGKIWSWWTGR